MFYQARHKRSFIKTHAEDMIAGVGMLVFFALPLLVWMIGG